MFQLAGSTLLCCVYLSFTLASLQSEMVRSASHDDSSGLDLAR